MLRSKIIYRLLAVFLLFSLFTMLPFSYTVVRQVNTMIAEEEALHPPATDEYADLHRGFSSRLMEQMVPYAFYILILAFMLSIFFLRKMLMSLKQLQKGSQELQKGMFDTRLEVLSEDELGDVTKAFNEIGRASCRERV